VANVGRIGVRIILNNGSVRLFFNRDSVGVNLLAVPVSPLNDDNIVFHSDLEERVFAEH
jgi:hypothetical protein